MTKDYHKNISYLTPEFINALVTKYGFDPNSLEGGDFKGAQLEAIELTEDHQFIKDKHKRIALEAIKKSYNMKMLYMALFNIMRAKTHPKEKLSDI